MKSLSPFAVKILSIDILTFFSIMYPLLAEIMTSTVEVKDDGKTRPIQKAKVCF